MSAEQYNNVDAVVRNLLLKEGETTLHKYDLYLRYALGFLYQFISHASREVCTERLTPNSLGVAPLPEGCVAYSKVGVQIGDKIINLSFNETLSNLPVGCCTDSCGVPTFSLTDISDGFHNFPFSVSTPRFLYAGYSDTNGQFAGGLYGWGNGGFGGHFKIDWKCRELRINSDLNIGAIYMEFLSAEIKPSVITPVNFFAVPAMEYYIKWQYNMDRSRPMYREFQTLYYHEMKGLAGVYDPFGVEECQRILDAHFQLAV